MQALVADDHPLYREAVARQIIQLFPDAAVDEAASFDEVITIARASHHDLFVFDFFMPGMSAREIANMTAAFPHVPMLVLSGGASATNIRAIIQAGARGFLPKTASTEQFSHTIQMLLAGGTSVPAELLLNEPLPGSTPSPWLAALTARETDVLRGAARGLSNKEIARDLKLAEVTVKLHLSAVFRKTGTRRRTEAIMLACKAGIS